MLILTNLHKHAYRHYCNTIINGLTWQTFY